MNLDAIKLILDQKIPNEIKEQLILRVLAKDEHVLPTLLEILTSERTQNKELIQDLNLEVSRYHIHIKDTKLLNKNKSFLNNETKTLYEKWKDCVRPLFNNTFNEV